MNKSNKYVCIHGHFYQPPRENAWLEVVELQDSAKPFHDWNERINFECYAPNTAARILDEQQFIIKIVNNYTNISYNFGPTLLSWLESNDPAAYQAIVESDKLSRIRFNGHGSALAQAYSHLILPLANTRDKKTQVVWGIRDFEHRFHRKPEGMWLPETAVNTDSLEALAAEGIRFTVLAPRQANAVRSFGEANWEQCNGYIDSRRPYLCKLPSGRQIVLFFYDGDVSQAVAFNGLLNDGKRFARALVDRLDQNDEPQLVHIATDGESYGHHHRYGEMALADCLNYIEEHHLARLTNYGEFLERFPPRHEVQIHENSSWSCVHGIERWRSDCGCSTGGNPGWNQRWREPLRNALDWLRDELIPIYEREAADLLRDPWAARDEYIEVVLDRSEEAVQRFVKQNARRILTDEEQTHLLRLMEMQRYAMLMYTSCGWFFDEISGIETNQILQYALRAIQFAAQVGGVDLHEEFVHRLAGAPSNLYVDGAFSYRKDVLPSSIDLERVGMHLAAASLFEKFPRRLTLYSYLATGETFERVEAGNQKMAVGRFKVKSKITYSAKHFSFAVLYLGQQHIIGNISIDMGREVFDEMSARLLGAFRSTDLGEVIGVMQTYFGNEKYSLWHLFTDEKRKILNQIMKKSLDSAETAHREFFNDNYQLMTALIDSDIPVPEAYLNSVEFILNSDLRRFFDQELLSRDELKRLVEEYRKWKVRITDRQALSLGASERIFREIKSINQSGVYVEQLQLINFMLETLSQLEIEPDVWKSQNLYFSMIRSLRNGEWWFVDDDWKREFLRLGEWLKVRSN